MIDSLSVQNVDRAPVGQRCSEHVERKGLGHPDTICDSVMEAVSQALCREYVQRVGRVLHHNIDKGLLCAGQTQPQPGGGTVLAPMRFIFGDRATTEFGDLRFDVGGIAEAAASEWLRSHLRFVDPQQHTRYQNEIRPGSPELCDIFARGEITANDTSAGVGYAPLSETEQLVLLAERYLNSPEFQKQFPEAGEDVKVMAVRRDRTLWMTLAVAFVDRFVPDQRTYFERKAAMRDALLGRLLRELRNVHSLKLDINTLDDPGRGEGGMYLTVLGTSAEGADGGQVGRGNRVNGLISLHRPMSLEAVAGKNPVSHVGKVYNVLACQIAEQIHASIDPVEEVTVWLCSQIGRRLSEPWSASVELSLKGGVDLPDVQDAVEQVLARELAALPQFQQRLINGELPVC